MCQFMESISEPFPFIFPSNGYSGVYFPFEPVQFLPNVYRAVKLGVFS